jgi:hypothetical protein
LTPQIQIGFLAGLPVEYFLVHGSNFVTGITFKWKQGPDLQILHPATDEKLTEQGIYKLVEERVLFCSFLLSPKRTELKVRLKSCALAVRRDGCSYAPKWISFRFVHKTCS